MSYMFSSQTTSTSLKKTISILLAVLFFLSPLGNVSHATLLTSGVDAFVTDVYSRSASAVTANEINEGSGNFSYTYDIGLPEGIQSLTPELSLQYNNQSATDMQVFGYGWSTSIPYIERINKYGSEQLFSTTTNTFWSSMSGELVADSGTYYTKKEQGNFLTYIRVGDGWEVVDKSGTTYLFGVASSSQQSDPADPSRISRWYLSSQTDTNGNAITYTYTKNTGVVYPDSITYAGIYEIIFTKESAFSEHTKFNLGFESTRSERIKSIELIVDTEVTKRFDLQYVAGISDIRDLLSSITETAVKGGNETSFSPVQFSYSGDQLPSWQTDSSYNFPEPLGGRDEGTRFGDLNGDGLTDMIRYYEYIEPGNSFVIRRVNLNRGDGNWDEDVAWSWDDIQVPFLLHTDRSGPDEYQDMGAKLVDVNGDGLDDYVVGYDCRRYIHTDSCPIVNEYWIPNEQTGVYINNGNGFVKDDSWTGLENFVGYFTEEGDFHNFSRDLIDVNGDGLPDLVTAISIKNTDAQHPSENVVSNIKVNTGANWVWSDLEFPASFSYPASSNDGQRSFNDYGTRVADINGDGLVDVIRSIKATPFSGDHDPDFDENTVYINTGDGWEEDTIWTLPAHLKHLTTALENNGFHFVDLNGDGLPEFFRSYDRSTPYTPGSSGHESEFYLNTGNGWSQEAYDFPFLLNQGARTSSMGQAFVDFDGDTVADVWDLAFSQLEPVPSSGGSVRKNVIDIPDVLTQITNKDGGTTSITYDGYLATVSSDNSKVGKVNINPVVVVQKTADSGFGNTLTETYEYEKAGYYATSTDIRDRKFAGFGTVTKTTDLGKEMTYYHQGNYNATTSEEMVDDESLIGLAYRQDTTDLVDNLYFISRYNYSTSSLGADRTFVTLDSEVRLDYDGDSDNKAKATSYTYDNTHGSVLSVTERGEVNANTDGTWTDIGNDDRTTQYTYATGGNGLVVLETQTVLDGTATQMAQSRFYYDNQPLGIVTTGNPTKQENWVSGTSYTDLEWTHDSYGNVLIETDGENNVTTYSYDIYNLYPTSVTNALNQVTQYAYDYRTGQVGTTTDPNGNTFVTQYDGFGRPTKEIIPDPQTSNPVTKTEWTYVDTPGSISIKTDNYLSDTIVNSSYQYLDGFGNIIQERIEAEEVNTYVVRDFVYGNNSFLEQESLPYFDTGNGRSAVTSNNDLLTSYTYDALGRVSSVSTVMGTTNTDYDQWIETVTDTENNEKDFTYDVYGRLAMVTEYNAGNAYNTTYDWDANDNLIKVTDAVGNERNITYDGLSRRTSLEDLHDPADTSYGIWSFEYDNANNLEKTIDPKLQEIVYSYDGLNRVVGENFLDTPGIEVVYEYDSCVQGAGYLCQAVNEAATTTYQYNHIGQLSGETKVVDNTGYTTGYEYNRLGNQTLITYPDGSEVRNTYNAGNQLEQIEQRESGGVFADVITDFDYGPHGMVTFQQHANGSETTKSYDAAALHRLSSVVTIATTSVGMGGPGAELAAFEAALDFDMPEFDLLVDRVAESEEVIESDEDVSSNDEVVVLPEAPPVLEDEVESASTTVVVEPDLADDLIAEAIVVPATSTPKSIEFVPELPISDLIEEVIASTSESKSLSPDLNSSLVMQTEVRQVIDELVASSTRAYGPNRLSTFALPNVERLEQVMADSRLRQNLKQQAKEKGMQMIIETKRGKHMRDNRLEIEIESMQSTEDGVEVYARAWKDNKQLGFGDDGSVDLERFRIFNPPLLVEDTTGGVDMQWQELDPATGEIAVVTRTLKYDPEEALLQTLENTIEKMENVEVDAANILENKRGNTTSIFFAHESGTGRTDINATSYANAQAGIPGPYSVGTSSSVMTIGAGQVTSNRYAISRGHLSFDTSVLNGVQIQAANVSIYQVTRLYPYATTMGNITNSTQADPTIITTADFLNVENVRFSTDLSVPNEDAWRNFDLNSAGIAAIEQGGYTTFAFRTVGDIDNVLLPIGNTLFYTAEEVGTVYDPQLVVEHISPPNNPTALETMSQVNPVDLPFTFPTFSAVFTDPYGADAANDYQIQVSELSDFSNIYWDSGKSGIAATLADTRTPEINYTGPALVPGVTYYWRIKLWDQDDSESSWSTETATFSLASNDPPPDPAGSTFGEVGSATLNGSVANVTFLQSYTDPVILADITTYNGTDPAEVRIDNITSTGFDLWVDEPEYLDGIHADETVNYLVIEKGVHTLPNGVVIEADTLDTNKLTKNGGFETVNFANSFSSTPVVLSQVQTHTDPVFVRTRQRNSSPTSFQVTLEEEELTANSTHGTETIGWVAITQTTGTLPRESGTVDFEATVTADDVRHQWKTKNFTQTFTAAPIMFGNVGKYDGGDASGLRMQNVTAGSLQIKVEEDKSKDTEIGHTTEAVNYLAIASPGIIGESTGGSNVPTLPIFREVVQDLAYTYDSVGNILRIIDNSETNTAGTIDYSYDDLYRLTSATTIGASTSPYTRTYSYDPLGNITNKSDQGAYSYGGNSGVNYANPHAVTDIAGVNYVYDQNGNLDSVSTGITHTWDQYNRLLQTDDNGSVTTYQYDHTGQRVRKDSSSSTTIYPSSLMEIEDGTMTKYIYADETLVATVKDDTPAPVMRHVHVDHLNSTNVITDDIGYVHQLLSVMPYGDTRIDERYGGDTISKQYTGHVRDEETSLNYMSQRYQSPSEGRFLSQDPLFISLGFAEMLTNPQRMNSYGYALNNPIVYDDPTGESASFGGFINFTVPRVDNMSGGYIGRDVVASQQGAQKLGRTAAYTTVGVGSVATVGVGLYFAPAFTIGAVSNMGVGAYEDSLDGKLDDGYGEYVTRGIIGGTAGRLTVGRGLPVVGSVAAGESIVTQGMTGDYQINSHEVLIDTGVAVGLRGGQSLMAPISHGVSAQGGFSSSISHLITELSVKIAAFQAFVSGDEGNDESDHE